MHPHHLQGVLSFYFAKVIKIIRLPVDDADASKHVGVLTIYKILFLYIYIYMCVRVCVCVCVFCAFVGLVNKLYKMLGTYIKITIHFYVLFTVLYILSLIFVHCCYKFIFCPGSVFSCHC